MLFNQQETEDKWKEHINSYSYINEDIINTLIAHKHETLKEERHRFH